MTREAAKGIDEQMREMGLAPKQGIEMLKAMAPSDLKFTGLKVDGKKATLEAAGKVGGEANRGTINLQEEEKWKVADQSWTTGVAPRETTGRRSGYFPAICSATLS